MVNSLGDCSVCGEPRTYLSFSPRAIWHEISYYDLVYEITGKPEMWSIPSMNVSGIYSPRSGVYAQR